MSGQYLSHRSAVCLIRVISRDETRINRINKPDSDKHIEATLFALAEL